MTISGISAALTAFRAAAQIAQSVVTARDIALFQAHLTEFQAKIIDANEAAMSAQDERATLLKLVGQLEKEVADLKAWEAEKKRYELKGFAFDFFAYALKPEEYGAEPFHYLCANCYANNKKSFLQGSFVVQHGTRRHICPACKNEVALPDGWPQHE